MVSLHCKKSKYIISSKYLGDSDISETLNTYSHMFDSALSGVINVMNNLKTK